MARPIKQGLEYFSFDTDFFSDRKVRRIMSACGPNSASILICLLCNIYKDKGYYIGWDKELPFDIADVVGVSEGAVDEVIRKALQVDFFNHDLFEKYGILTSGGIQKRFKSSTLKRREIEINPDYWVIDVNNSINDVKIPSIITLLPPKSTQKESKVEESKVKRKEKENSTNVEQKKTEELKKLAAAKAATQKRRDVFYKSLIPYVERYGSEMIRAFYDYWSELTKSETKMKFELNKTWELGKRLATWAKNDYGQGKSNSSISKSGSGNGNISRRIDAENKRAERDHLGALADAILQCSSPKDD